MTSEKKDQKYEFRAHRSEPQRTNGSAPSRPWRTPDSYVLRLHQRTRSKLHYVFIQAAGWRLRVFGEQRRELPGADGGAGGADAKAEKGKEGESEPPVLLGVAYTLASPSDPLDLGAPIITALERNCEAFTMAQELGQASRRPDCLCKTTNAMTKRLQFVTNRWPWFCSCSSPRWFLPEVVVASA